MPILSVEELEKMTDMEKLELTAQQASVNASDPAEIDIK
jgi:hypothetical protein